MREYTFREQKELRENPYTYKVTKHQLYFTKEFKKDFWQKYQAGYAPRRIFSEFGYNLNILKQKQIDGIVQRIKKEALSGNEFSEGYVRKRRVKSKINDAQKVDVLGNPSDENIRRMQAEITYLRQEIEFLKKNIIADHMKKKK